MEALPIILECFLTGTLIFYRADAVLSSTNSGRKCRASEREALLEFKHGLQDPFGRLSAWSEAADCCSWTGITCHNKTNHVTELNLRNDYLYYEEFYTAFLVDYGRALSGDIGQSLLHLNHLQHLDLSGNNFSHSPIPKFIGSFKRLRYLNLSHACVVGTIPSQFGNLSNLNFLDLSYNEDLVLRDAEWISNVSPLRTIHLDGVNLENSFFWLQALNKLPSISVITLRGCSIQAIPTSLPHLNFSSLSKLVLSGNDIINFRLPEWLFRLNNLEYLVLENNAPYSDICNDDNVIPSEIGNLSKLRVLSFSNIKLCGSIPYSLGGLSSLQELDLSFNKLHGLIPTSLGLTSLKKLYLQSNQLSGQIPPTSLAGLTSLQDLDLSFNNLSGPIPWSIGRLPSLQVLNLQNNRLNGSIPSSIRKLRSLQKLSLQDNSLTGAIPESLCGLLSIRELDLSSNDGISGAIPPCIWELKEIQVLGLGGDGLEGLISDASLSNLPRLQWLTILSPSKSLALNVSEDWVPPFKLSILHLESFKVGPEFPMWIQTQDKLQMLILADVEIEGNLPSWIWSFSSVLGLVDLHLNEMSGTLPSATSAPSLIEIDLGYNRFEGPLFFTTDISKLMPNLVGLLLPSNMLTGDIPSSMCEFSGFWPLDLSGNHFTGEIPECFMQLAYILNLAGNNLSGVIPPYPSGGSSRCILNSLRLSDNNLSGVIPFTLSNCEEMEILDLGQNKLTGEVPSWISTSMPSLVVLRLRSNSFSGTIPSDLSAIDALQNLDLANNNLSGGIPRTFGDFKAMKAERNSIDEESTVFQFFKYQQTILVSTKGQERLYGGSLSLLTNIDLSNNGLVGDIPGEIGSLGLLVTLNLSSNHLTSIIPTSVVKLKKLETLDLSNNNLTGGIPSSMSAMTLLSYLNLSNNNLSGPIPSGGQFYTFASSSFSGNRDLCGPPLSSCNQSIPEVFKDHHLTSEDYSRDKLWALLGMLLGFVTGFWTFYGILFFKKRWRHNYFQFVSDTSVVLYFKYHRPLRLKKR